MKNLKLYKIEKQKGITLIALIITIIVLLILAGISINAIVGDNGVIKKATWAGFVSEYEAVNEQKEIYRVSEQTERYLINYKKISNLSLDELKVLYPIKGEERNIDNESITLQKTIEKIDGRENAILYEIDLGKIDQKVKRRYIVNLKTGTLYAIEGEDYKGQIWHLPKVGIKKDGDIELPENPPVEKEYILTYNTKGGSPQPQEQKDKNSNGNAVFQIRNDEVTKSGYIFKCWKKKIGVDENLKDIYGEYEYQGGEDIEITEDTELCAIWEKLESQYALVYNVNGGTAIGTQTYTTNEEELEVEITETIPKKNGYLFKGWSEDNTKTGEGELNPKDKITISGVKTIYAVWEDEGISGSISVKTSENKDKLLTDTKIKYSASANKSKISKIEVYFVTGQESSRVETKVYNYNLATASNNLNNLEVNFTNLIFNNIKNLKFYEDYETKLKITTDNNSVIEVAGNTIKNYTVGSEISLRNLASTVNGGNDLSGELVEQIDNITLIQTHTAIGTESQKFKGTYDGCNKTINNIQINNTSAYQGLFGYVEDATIKNLKLGTGSVTGGNRVGGAVGYAKNSTLNNLKNNGTKVTTTTTYNDSDKIVWNMDGILNPKDGLRIVCAAGGICGKAENSNFKDCTNNIEIVGIRNFTGGIVGQDVGDGNKISNCTNTKKISGGAFTGGIVGGTKEGIIIENCSNSGNIEDKSDFGGSGGIAGIITEGKIINCNNTGGITGNAYIGGISGICSVSSTSTYAIVENCNNSGIVSSSGSVSMVYYQVGASNSYNDAATGGIVGYGERVKISGCYNTQSVTGIQTAEIMSFGGIIGDIRNGNIEKCYNKGAIGKSNLTCIGGIAGSCTYNVNVIESCNIGSIIGCNNIGGVIGYGADTNVRYCYNVGTVNGSGNCSYTGGVVGNLGPYYASTYGNSYLYYCYNAGTVTGINYYGSMGGYISFIDIDYVYSLYGTTSKTDTHWGYVDRDKYGNGYYKNASHQGWYQKSATATVTEQNTLCYKVINDFVYKDTTTNITSQKFKADTNNINNGFPILMWQ